MRDFDIPEEGLSESGQKAAELIVEFLKKKGRLNSGGCRVFYSPQEWKDRQEEYGTESLLIVVHDGGDHAAAFNLDYENYKLFDEMNDWLEQHGFFHEPCTCWYTSIYQR